MELSWRVYFQAEARLVLIDAWTTNLSDSEQDKDNKIPLSISSITGVRAFPKGYHVVFESYALQTTISSPAI